MLFICILVLQFLAGFGIVDRFSVITRLAQKISLSILIGFFLSTLAVYVLEILHLPISAFSVMTGNALLAAAINYNPAKLIKSLKLLVIQENVSIKIYEIIFLTAIAYLLFFSFWRTYSIPVTPYDSIVGIDLVARRALKEGHIVSSLFFREDFRPYLSTQPYYAPFTMLMQIIYRSVGLPFGQVWLGLLTVCFFVFAYSKMCEKVHPIIAGFCILLLLCAPELYAYTFLLQTDFSNAVFFAIGMIFTVNFLRSGNLQHFTLAAIFMSAACWTRTETIIIVAAITLVLAVLLYSEMKFRVIKLASIYLAASAASTFLWNVIFFKFYFPVTPQVREQIIWKGLYSYEKTSMIFNGMNFFLFSMDYWGCTLYLFILLWLINFFISRNGKAWANLGWPLLIYICFFIMLHHFSLMNIEYTFRRGVMKFLLVMCLLTSEFPILNKHFTFSKQS
ncbi:hypothetical protein FEM33_00335 [Dyadobacter flavalbus]|uniref:Glycosyltransferase RgtA/B/C/D-like domain-containing protein n=1 Tax=Dyadobacter flavalbus TaxID=2579942 RepID=A0A5M8R4B3_9BACT|nr:hypothetical protein [Dyadobacter flavalbus]KAA6441756.1 hypothetical protein FEM33_00335 [Dyadobacter flavalbus]